MIIIDKLNIGRDEYRMMLAVFGSTWMFLAMFEMSYELLYKYKLGHKAFSVPQYLLSRLLKVALIFRVSCLFSFSF